MQLPSRQRVRFSRPPVVEVACGVTFSFPESLKTAHVGAFWEKIRNEFPTVQDAQPLAVITERPGVTAAAGMNFEMLDMPPLRRAWFLSADGESLVQLQEDRFLVNWRRAAGNSPSKYPTYEVVIERFKKLWSQFQKFASETGLGVPTILQLELVYVNAIVKTDGFAGSLPSVLIDHSRSTVGERFLPSPEVFNWQTSYNMGNDRGRLHVVAQTAVNTANPGMGPVLRLDLTARGLPQDTEVSGIAEWFNIAHGWITHGFADVTTTDAQNILWGRES